MHNLGQQLPSNATTYASKDIINKCKKEFNERSNVFVVMNNRQYSKGISLDNLVEELIEVQKHYFKGSKVKDTYSNCLECIMKQIE